MRKKLERWVEIKNKRNTYHHCLLHATRGQGWWWLDLVPMINRGRVACAANGIAIILEKEPVRKCFA
jgi:hypothetical protein